MSLFILNDRYKSFHELTLKKTTILFFNSDALFAVGLGVDNFWRANIYHDTIIISDRSYNLLLNEKFKNLKDTTKKMKEDIICSVAFIREYDNNYRDTIYSSPSLKFWQKGDKYFVDTSGFFKKSFRAFLIYE